MIEYSLNDGQFDTSAEQEATKATHSQNQNRPKSQNMSPNFGYIVQKC